MKQIEMKISEHDEIKGEFEELNEEHIYKVSGGNNTIKRALTELAEKIFPPTIRY